MPPRDLIIIAGKDPTAVFGGTASYIRAFCRAATKAGYSPHIFCVGDHTGQQETEFGLVHRAWSPVRPVRGLMARLHQPFIVKLASRFVGNRVGPHLIHSFGPWSGVGAALAKRLRARGLKTIALATPFSTYEHETQAKLIGLRRDYPLAIRLQFRLELLWIRLTVNPSERRGFRSADLVVPNYENVRMIVEAAFGPGIRFGKMTYASEQAFLDAGAKRTPERDLLSGLEPREAPLIVSISRHDPRKGLDVLLLALVELKARGLRFRACLIGGGQLLETHRRLADKLGLQGCTVLPGSVPDAYAYLRQADIFVLPSIEEGSGSMSLLEAMQAGVAPVVSRVDGLPEDVRDGESALLAEPGDVGDLTDALSRCLTDFVLRAKVAAGAYKCYQTRFSADAFVADIRRIYASVGFACDAQ